MATAEAELACRECHLTLPIDRFHRHAGRATGYHELCRGCRSKVEAQRRRHERRTAERWSLLKLVRAMKRGKIPAAASLLLEPLLRHFGGAEGLGRAIANELGKDSTDGDKRLDLLAALMESAKAIHESAAVEAVRYSEELNRMSNEELERQIAVALHRYRRSKGNVLPSRDRH